MNTPPAQAPSGLLESLKRYPGVDLLYHVAYYHAARVGYQDIVSRSLHDFKDGCEPQTARWIALAAPRVCKDLGFQLIVRALATTELKPAEGTPLDRLCEAIAGGSGATCAPGRLEKERAVRAMTSLGGRAARAKELEGVYRFDASGLAPETRILVVDDIATTGATLEAIQKAILRELPQASVTCFVLARVEAQLQNTHIDSNYFLKGVQADPLRSSIRMTSARAAVPSERLTTSAKMPAPHQQAVAAGAQRPRKGPSTLDIPGGAGPRTQSVKSRGGIHTRFYVFGLMLSLLLLGATVLIPAKKDPVAPTSQFVQLVNQNAITSPEPIPERRSEPGLQGSGKPAIVTVPSTGLRTSHSLESRVIPRITVRLREHVEILRRFTSRTGPDWIQVRTKEGTVGWVIASVVREVHG